MQASLLLALLALVDALENEVGSFGLIDADHLHSEAGAGSGHQSREGFLTDFALEFSEIV